MILWINQVVSYTDEREIKMAGHHAKFRKISFRGIVNLQWSTRVREASSNFGVALAMKEHVFSGLQIGLWKRLGSL